MAAADKKFSMLEEYKSLKSSFKDCILFYQVGEFFEIIGADVENVAKDLSILVTKRSDQKMCGFPVKAMRKNVIKLIKKRKKIVLFAQCRDEKNHLKREVINLFTPGTIADLSYLEENDHSILCAVKKCYIEDSFFIAWSNMITGDFFYKQAKSKNDLLDTLATINPSEILSENTKDIVGLEKLEICFTDFSFMKNFANSRFTHDKEDFKNLSACQIIEQYIEYVKRNSQESIAPKLFKPKLFKEENIMAIDFYTRKNLGISLNDFSNCSIVNDINKSLTPPGKRFFTNNLLLPLLSIEKIVDRQNKVKYFFDQKNIRSDIRNFLSGLGDFERAIAHIMNGSSSQSNILCIKKLVFFGEKIESFLLKNDAELNYFHRFVVENSLKLLDLRKLLSESIADCVIQSDNFKTVIKKKYDRRLDVAINFLKEEKELFNSLQKKIKISLGLNKVKIERNNVFGYCIEVSKDDAEILIKNENFFHKQTLNNSVRFKNNDLDDLESKILFNKNIAEKLEFEILNFISSEIRLHCDNLYSYAKFITKIDFYSGLAFLAEEQDYCAPKFNNQGIVEIEGLFHPSLIKKIGAEFVKNKIIINKQSFCLLLLTSPNMSGKSTLLRQLGILSILAQMGSFVPARFCNICIFDKIFCRTGAADDISNGLSTFMVEMSEISRILNNATENSLVLIDELGRGTSYKEGLAIAQAVMEYLHDSLGCISLIATHYHELAKLEKILSKISLMTLRTKLLDGLPQFGYLLEKGFSNISYATNIARLANFSDKIIDRIEELLDN